MNRESLISAIATFLDGHDPQVLAELRASLEREIDAAGPDALAQLSARLSSEADAWTYYAPDPLARRIHHVLAERILHPGSAFDGLEHVHAVAGKPVVVLANHLSYSDANLLEILLTRFGGGELADRLVAVAGPKVYSSLKRRFSSLCFGTVRVPQSSELSTEDAVMNPREVARAARKSINAADDRLRRGDAVLVFAEGRRSRTTGMQPLLAGVTRYLEVPGTWILPVGITGTETLFPIGDEALHPVQIVARAGAPIDAAALSERCGGDRQKMMDTIGRAIAALLPSEYKGTYC
jgi:1-acyl-sn-glycerol-3-phosphate acyltransferase